MGLEYGSDRGAEFEKWKWIDGWPVTRSNWVGKHPDTNIGRCAFINKNGNFETSDCNHQRPFVCKAEFYDIEAPSWAEIDAALGQPLTTFFRWVSSVFCVLVFDVFLIEMFYLKGSDFYRRFRPFFEKKYKIIIFMKMLDC